jgi:hypothetical protein
VEDDVPARALERERLVEVGRRRRVEGEERPVGAVDVAAAGPPLRRLHRGEGDFGREPGRHLELLAHPLEAGVEHPIDVPW